MRPRVLLASSVASVCLLAFGGCRSKQTPQSSAGDCTLVEDGFGPEGTVPVRAEVVARGLKVPWSIAFLPGGDLLVTEREGRLRLIEKGQIVEAAVAEVGVRASGEGGLMGLALHPGFSTNRLFFLYFTHEKDGSPQNRVERWRLSEDHRSAQVDKVILDRIPAAQFHDGGRIRVGPDKMLYVATGDAKDPDRSQDRASLSGKLLRLKPDGEVPDDNPIPGNPLWMSGLRNPEGFDWGDSGTLLIADHGPSGELGRKGHDEINVASKGANLGWPTIFGCGEQAGMISPSLTWKAAVPPGGAAVYTGTEIGDWRGNLLVGTLGSRHLHRVVFREGGRKVSKHEVYFQGDPPRGFGRLREVVMGPDGHLYVTTSNCDGRGSCPPDGDKILRIRAGAR